MVRMMFVASPAGHVAAPLPLAELLATIAPDLAAEDIAHWTSLQAPGVVDDAVALRTTKCVAAYVAQTAASARAAPHGQDGEDTVRCCQGFAVLDAILSCASNAVGQTVAEWLLPHLDAAYDHLIARAADDILFATRAALPWNSTQPMKKTPGDSLRWPLLVLARCSSSPSSLTWRHVLDLARYDLATAVALLLSVAEADSAPFVLVGNEPIVPPRWVRTWVWQILYALSTPTCAVELYMRTQTSAEISANDTPMAELQARQIAHAHRLTFCLVQLCAADVAASCSQTAYVRSFAVAYLLHALHNLVASPQLRVGAEPLARHLAARWATFGTRCLAPHFRRLLGGACVGEDETSASAATALRRDLRTIGWMLFHTSACREAASSLLGEVALRSLRQDLSADTLATVLVAAANAGSLGATETLSFALQSLSEETKAQLSTAALPHELRRHLWVTEQGLADLIRLGLWQEGVPANPPAMQTTSELQAGCQDAGHSAGNFGAAPGHSVIAVVHEGCVWEVSFPGFDSGISGPLDSYNEYSDGLHVGSTLSHGDCVGDDGWEEVDEFFGDENQQSIQAAKNNAWDGPCVGGMTLPAAPPWTSQLVRGIGMPPATVLLCEAPGGFRCSLDARLCSDPVRTPHGLLYDKAQILLWLRWKRTCPVSGYALAPEDLHQDAVLQESIADWLRRGGCLCE